MHAYLPVAGASLIVEGALPFTSAQPVRARARAKKGFIEGLLRNWWLIASRLESCEPRHHCRQRSQAHPAPQRSLGEGIASDFSLVSGGGRQTRAVHDLVTVTQVVQI